MKTYMVETHYSGQPGRRAMVDARTPTEAAETHARELAKSQKWYNPELVWVRLARKGSKWVLYHVWPDGQATRAKSLPVEGTND